jgi:hypothetical protein
MITRDTGLVIRITGAIATTHKTNGATEITGDQKSTRALRDGLAVAETMRNILSRSQDGDDGSDVVAILKSSTTMMNTPRSRHQDGEDGSDGVHVIHILKKQFTTLAIRLRECTKTRRIAFTTPPRILPNLFTKRLVILSQE